MAKDKRVDANVPTEDQPYPIPENWQWVFFSSVIKLISGRDAALSECNSDGMGIPYILGASNIDNNQFYAERWIECPQVVSRKGDVLLSVKGTIGKLYEQQEEAINISRQIMAIRPCFSVSSRFVYLFLSFVCEELREAGNGLIPGISRSDILEKPFPLMPLPEQQRIVDRIESLFAKLDEAKEKAQAVVDGYEDRKAAILHQAFTGELTAEWREKKNIEKNSWKTITIDDICEVFSGKGFKESEYSQTGVKLLRISNVTYDTLVWDDTKYLPDSYIVEVPELVLHAGDIVMALNRPITNGKLKVSLVDDNEKYILYQRVGCLRVRKTSSLLPKYLQFALLSKDFLHQVEENLQGSDQPYINLPPLKKLIVNICSIKEQEEIVSILKKTIEQEERVNETAEQVISRIDTMKKAILARAFRGELGTNDPSEPPADIGIL